MLREVKGSTAFAVATVFVRFFGGSAENGENGEKRSETASSVAA
jgi:hypothetical protein